ncbi:hypothetical protein BC830DRAFT_1081011 [Chytriomyces sp. MP71]|nr:hypothetical protein BC830DRAFT_1081011 [Chytriomyces sp. MP71]
MSWFGGSGSASSSGNKKKKSGNARASMGSFEFGADDDVEGGMDVGDVENDAALLAELAGLQREMGLSGSGTVGHPPGQRQAAGKQPAKAAAPPPSKHIKPAVPRVEAKPAPVPAAVAMEVDAQGLVEITLPEDITAAEQEVEVDFTDADMNDPLLLAELAAVSSSDNDHDREVEASGLYAQPVNHANNKASSDDDGLAALRADMEIMSSQKASAPVPEGGVPLAVQLECSRPETVAQYIALSKLRATNAKAAGDASSAAEYLKASKALEARHDQLILEQNPGPKPEPASASQSASVSVSIESVSSPSVATVSSISLLDVKRCQLEYKQAALAFNQRGDKAKARELLIISKSMQETIDLADAGGSIPSTYRLPEPPQTVSTTTPSVTPVATSAAVADRKSGSVSKATTPQLVQPLPVPSTPTPAKKVTAAATTPQLTASTAAPSTIATKMPSLPVNTPEILNHIHGALESQIAACTAISAAAFKSGDKPRALAFHKRKKQYSTDFLALASVRAGASVPLWFSRESVRYEIETLHADVGVEEMEIGVKGVAAADVECFVAFDVGWPTEGGEAGKGACAAVKGVAPEFAYTKRVPIERNRAFQRHLERKRAVFDVFHQAKGWGGLSLFSKPVQVGRVSVPLAALLNKCEIHEVFDIVDIANPRRSVGGKLEIHIRLRAPLAKKDITLKEEQWIVLEYAPPEAVATVAVTIASSSVAVQDSVAEPVVASIAAPAALELPSTATPVAPTSESVSSRPATPQPPTSGAQTPKKSATPVPATIAPAAPGAAEATVDIDEAELEFLNPDTIASNMVLEAEHGALVAQITALKAAKKPVPEELMDRKNGYEIRMNMLVTLVQFGTLTMPDYIASVKTSIVATKRQALLFKQHGKVDRARQAVARIKAMTDEVAEVEEAIRNGDM